MKRLLIATFAVLGAASLAEVASADLSGLDQSTPVMVSPRMLQELRTAPRRLLTSTHVPNDTTYVGFNPAYAGSNYWSIGVGHRRPPGNTSPIPDADTGFWDWDHPVHGDSLQGWWPIRHNYHSFFIVNQSDVQRPWHAIDMGNQISYVINQGPGFRRTFGVTGAWHVDAGRTAQTLDAGHSDVNPKPPRWTPISGSKSAWCGLRAHGDVTAMDAVTGNPYNVDALEWVQHGRYNITTAAGWTNHKFPGYAGQWDQMLYRDIDISGASASANVLVSFRYRTRMSTAKSTNPTTQTGWFDKDPLTVVAGNFISATNAGTANSPIDSFMVYVGAPVGDNAGDDWTGSDGLAHQVFDPVRRWFGELIRANEAGGHYELFTTYGNRPPITTPADSNAFVTQTTSRNVNYGQLRAAWGNRIRLVFRIKTNRGNETFSDDVKGSLPGAYTSGYLGAAQLDDVGIDLGSGTVSLGGFENDSDIDNRLEATALAKWKTSSKPPGITFHVHDLSDLMYEDLCGPPTSKNRACDMAGGVVSMGDHDLGEAAGGALGTADYDQYQAMYSPTINLAFDPANPTAKNNMGLDADTAVPTAGYAIFYNIYAGWFDALNTGQSWQIAFQCYPAAQSDGTRMWGDPRHTNSGPFQYPTKQCFDTAWIGGPGGEIRTINANGLPDSIRIGLIKTSQCNRFGLTTNCGGMAGGYLDNISLAIIDASTAPLAVSPYDLWNDTFPANETAGLPGTAAFDTTAALIKTGYNIAYIGDPIPYDVPADSLLVDALGDSVEVRLEFRILPGPGNYKIPGDVCSGLRRVPTDTTRITPGDGSFWTQYILNPGKAKDAFPTTGPCKGGGPLRHDQRWSELTWCNARMDTAEWSIFPVQARASSYDVLGGPRLPTYASMYHEADPHLAALGLSRHKCFLVDTAGPLDNANITCSSVPAWVTAAKGYDGNPNTVEGTKIIPDGILTPGSHVEYFFLHKDLRTGATAMAPDTNVVYPQPAEQSLDGHRWQQFGVLPDAWKYAAYGGLGKACLLYVDGMDRYGEERAWVSIADSIGATRAAKRGAHNGWTGAPAGADINDPAYFVNRNAQPGTTWDMYGLKGFDQWPQGPAAGIGSRLAYRGGGTLLTDKWAKNAPTPEMMAAYYRILMILTGDFYGTGLFIGPHQNTSSDETEFIRQFVTGATAGAHRGLWCGGSFFVEDFEYNGNTIVPGILGVSLREDSFLSFSGNSRTCIDLIPTSAITTNGDIYGLRNNCLSTTNVLNTTGDAQPASYFDAAGSNPLNAPYIAGVFQDAETTNNPDRHYQTLVDAFSLTNLRSRMCDASSGRLAYVWNVFNNVFGKICAVAGSGPLTTEVPNNGEGKTFVDLAGVGNNPLREGSAVIHLTLAHADRVTVRIYDVSGRLVRTLADGQMFKAGKVDPALTWDGLDNAGRQVARGAYFVAVRYEKSGYAANRKMIVLR